MAFVGLRKPEDRAAVIEYMRINDSNPESRPVPAVVEVMEEAVEVIEGSDIEATDAAETVTTILEDAVETVTDAVEETTER